MVKEFLPARRYASTVLAVIVCLSVRLSQVGSSTNMAIARITQTMTYDRSGTTSFSTFCISFHIFVVGEDRDFKIQIW